MAENIHNGLVVGNMSAYVWWYIRRSYSLIGQDDGKPTERGYMIAQYSKYVRPGDVRIDATEQPNTSILVSAYKHSPTQVEIVAVNKGSSDVTQQFDVSGRSITNFSCKGLKAGDSDASLAGNITISGGALTLNTSDDAIHCGGTLNVSGGEITIDTADDALHCDKYLNIGGGTVRVNRSCEGFEAMQIRMTAGDVTVYAEDDPFNAAEKGVVNQVDVANDNCIFQIDGGCIHAYVTNEREGDGIDSNGKIVINGGEVYVEGSVSGPDSALDSDGEMLVNGGIVMAIGGLGRGELPEKSSGQNSLYWGNSQTTYAKGSVVALTDGQGNVLLSYTSEQTFKCAVISSDAILAGEKYAITVNGNQVAEFTVSAALTTQGDIGSSGGSSGGPGDPGGRNQ